MGAILAGAVAFLSATIVTVNGVVPVVLLAPLVAVGFILRFAGATYAAGQGRWTMPWFPRVASWFAFGAAVALLGLAGSVLTVAAFGAYVVVDALTGLVKRDVAEKAPKKKSAIRWKRVLQGGALGAYLAGVVAYHLVAARYFSFGTLITWSLLALGFSVVLMVALKGSKAPAAWRLAPADHRVHERREKAVADPQRARAEAVLITFRARGDAGPFLDLVREAGRAADFPEAEMAALERRILQHLARAGTRRDEDIRGALDEVEKFLSLRTRTLETRP